VNDVELLLGKLKSFDVSAIIADILKDEVIGRIIITTIQERLESSGTIATGRALRTDIARSSRKKAVGKYGAYSKKTELIKSDKGQEIRFVTLKDTGEFYSTFISKIKNNSIELDADFRNIYDNFQDSFKTEEEFQTAILDISDDELKIIFDNYIYPKIEQKTLEYFGL